MDTEVERRLLELTPRRPEVPRRTSYDVASTSGRSLRRQLNGVHRSAHRWLSNGSIPSWLTAAVTSLVALVVATSAAAGPPPTMARPSRSPAGSRRTLTPSSTASTTISVPTTTEEDIDQLYLGRGTVWRLACPLTADPPSTIIVWTRNGSVLEPSPAGGGVASTGGGGGGGGGGPRTKINRSGTLVILSADSSDEGLYVCATYSPLGRTEKSRPVRVLVRGESATWCGSTASRSAGVRVDCRICRLKHMHKYSHTHTS